jgi:predicted oxidoreductase
MCCNPKAWRPTLPYWPTGKNLLANRKKICHQQESRNQVIYIFGYIKNMLKKRDPEKIDLIFLNKPILLIDAEVAASAVTEFFQTYIYP